MTSAWSRDFLTRRIDRCYLIAAGAKIPEKRKMHLELARHYRRILGSISDWPSVSAGWMDFAPGDGHAPRVSS
jgi:hypothetical protein